MTCAGTSYDRAPIWSRGSFLSYALDSFWQSIYIPAGRTYRLGIYVYLSRYAVVILDCHSSDEELSCRLDATDLLPCVVVSLVISIGRSNWLDDERSPLEISSD